MKSTNALTRVKKRKRGTLPKHALVFTAIILGLYELHFVRKAETDEKIRNKKNISGQLQIEKH